MFDSKNLPKLRKGTSGHAYPRPEVEVIMSEVPCAADFPLPESWGGDTKAIDSGKGYYITGLAVDDIYPNDEYNTFYETGDEVRPDDDPRARIIYDFWKNLGHEVKTFRATKTKPAIVVGVLDEAGQFETKEGLVNFNPGDVLLESPNNRGQMWRNEASVFAKKYDDQGIRPGDIPS